jgi:serine/threonine protein kinase/Tol biopolymer transport system component
MALSSGAKLGPYEIQSPLGAGGMGEVYRARDTRLGRDVAIKVLPESFATDPDRLQRFQQEARVLSALNHPNLLAVYDVGVQDGVNYLVSELLEGQTLRERISGTMLPARKVTEYALQIANGLAAAHDKQVVHRDLKPDNVFLTRDERVKILDFGLAKQARAAAAGETATLASSATAAGIVMGTAGYMSPEQVRGRDVGHRSDIFSLGAMLYEMISGKQAFHRDSGVETMNAILKEEPPEFTETGLSVSPGLERIVRRCLEKAPERRFQSASDLAFALEALSGTATSKTGLRAVPNVSLFRRRTAGVAAASVLMIALLAFLAGNRFATQPSPTFTQLAFGPGYVSSARFTPDGSSVVYGAAWNGKPIEIFSTRLDGIESRSLGLDPADVLATSANGEMAILLGRHHFFQWMTTGTLGRASLSGGAARPLLENVADADITADGKDLAIVRNGTGQQWLEFPIGKTLYRTSGWIDHPAISPAGDAVALIDHPIPGDDRGSIVLVNLSGRSERLTTEWSALKGMVWSRRTGELWFSGSTGGEALSLHAVARSGKQRVVLSAPVDLQIRDINAQGQVLLLASRASSEIAIRRPGLTSDRVLDFNSGVLEGMSDDGSLMTFAYTGAGSGTDYLAYVSRTDSPGMVRLGEGSPSGISPDGKWVIAFRPSSPGKINLYPTGTGQPRDLDIGSIEDAGTWGSWTRDSSRFAFTGSTLGKPPRTYVIDLASGKATAVTPEGTSGAIITPDGHFVLARTAQGFALYPVDGGAPQPVHGISENEFPVQWALSGFEVYVWDHSFPAHIILVDIRSGKRWPALETKPPDPAGVLYANFFITPDGKSYAYRYRRVLSTLYVADGLR